MSFRAYRKAYLVPAPREAHFEGKTTWEPDSILIDGSWGIRDRSGMTGMAARYADAMGISRDKSERNLCLVRDLGLAREAYRISTAANGVSVTASSVQGFLHALATIEQLRNGPMLPVGTIQDHPRLPMRGFHLMFESIHQIRSEEALSLVTSAARLKLNTVLVEFGDRFPFQRHSAVRSPSALTREELAQLVDHAQSLGVEPIPLQQSLGHLRYLLEHDEYAHVREEDEHRDQMCPTNEDSFRIFTELAEEVLEFFPNARFMHIGADETRRLGVCPRCRERAAKEGIAALYLGHINRVCSWLDDRGIIPILWDDILCAHPQMLGSLHESAWIMYWDYWTTRSPSPLIVARYNPDGGRGVVVYDKRWQDEWVGELDEVTSNTLGIFAEAVDMEQRLGPEFMEVYGPYLGDELPKSVPAFPYLEWYRAAGRHVIGGPAGASNTSDWLDLPDFPRYTRNIKAFAERCIEAGAEGLITTAWYNFPPEAFYLSLLATAQYTW